MKTLLPLVFALTLAVPLVRAEDVLEIPEPCGSHSELEREIAALRASSRNAPDSARPAVRLVREGAGYVLTVELADGRRSLRDPDCRALFRAAIVIAALGHESSVENVLDASETGRAAEPTPVPVPQAAQSAASEERGSREPENTTREEATRPSWAERRARRRADEGRLYPRKLSARALLRAEVAYGLVPDLSGVFGLGIALEYARFSARAAFAYRGPPRTHHDGDQGVTVDALSGSPRSSWWRYPGYDRASAWTWRGCAGAAWVCNSPRPLGLRSRYCMPASRRAFSSALRFGSSFPRALCGLPNR